jgi:HTH-type transcriptional regulator/antitoxin HigA
MLNTTNKSGNKTPGTPNRYLELITQFPPRKISSKKELEATQKVIDSLLDQEKLTIDERDYLHLLGLLVSEYEDKNYPISDIYGVELLKVLMEERNLTTKDLSFIFDSEEKLTQILNNQVSLTLEQIQKLAQFFNISSTVFLEEN